MELTLYNQLTGVNDSVIKLFHDMANMKCHILPSDWPEGDA